jgi:predicted NBD/HSP70 family sugar kinase
LTNKTQEANINPTMTEKRRLATHAAAQVFRAVLTGGPLRRADLTGQTGLSQPTIAKITRTLIDAGYLVELDPSVTGHGRPGGRRAAVGRPAAPLDVRADREFFVGVKVTGDELIGVLTDLRANIRATRHEPLSGHDPAEVAAAIRRLVTRLRGASAETRARTYDLGVSVAGDVDRERGIARYEPFHGWRDVPLAALLSKATGLSTVVDNDIRALTEAENWFGAGARAESFLLVAIGTGVTCGLVVDGKVRAGAYGVAGELGHVGVDRQGPKCYCGARGCLEAVASDPAIARRVAEITGDPTVDVRAAVDRAPPGPPPVRGG